VRHGTLSLVISAATFLFAAAFGVVVWQRAGSAAEWAALVGPLLILVVLTGAAWYFSTMTVEVTDTELRWQLGF